MKGLFSTLAPGALPRRIRMPRTVGLGLGGVCVAGALLPHGAPAWAWALLAFNALAWPQLAYGLSASATQPKEAERRNLLLDSLLGAFWLPAMGFNLLASVLLIVMLTMNNLAFGGWRLFGRGLAAQVLGVAGGLVAFGWRPAFESGVLAVAAALPFLIVYPMAIGWVTYRLASGLARKTRELARSERLYRETMDAMDAGIVLYDADDRLVLCNEDFRRLYGPLASTLVPGKSFEQLLREAVASGLIPEAREREDAWMAERLQAHRHPGPPHHRELPDGRWRRILEKRLTDGSLLAFSIDITELVQARREAQQAQSQAELARERLQDAIEALPDGFALYDAQDRLLVCNERYRAMYAASAPAIERGAPFETLVRYGLEHAQYPEAAGREEAWLAERLEQHRRSNSVVMQQLPGNRWVRINERKTREGGFAGVRTEVTDLVRREQELSRLLAEREAYQLQLQEANRKLAHLSETDALTGVANRRLFDERLQEEWQRAERQGTPLALLLVDVDYFKRFNDRHGHLEGDACLRTVAQVLAGCARRTGELVARYGGEEFVALLPGTSLDEAVAIGDRFAAALARAAVPHADSPIAAHVTASVGAASLMPGRHSPSPRALVRLADGALYAAKAHGRNQVAAAGADTALPTATDQP